jgi:integrase
VADKFNESEMKKLPVPGKGAKTYPFAGAILQGKQAPAGFNVRVTANGIKSGLMRYRHKGVERFFTFGTWPDWSCLAMVEEARRLRQRIDRGEDPAGERVVALEAAKDTFKAIFDTYMARDGKALRTAKWRQQVADRLILPALGSLRIGDIKRSTVVNLLDKIEDANGPTTADHVLKLISKIMNWHATRTDDYQPVIVRGMSRISIKEHARQRILSDDELRVVWKAAVSFKHKPFGELVRFILMTGCRRSEAARMEWPELDGANWTLPAARNKTGVDLLRPLSKQAMAALPAKGAGKFVFSTDGGHTPVGNFTVWMREITQQSGTSGWTIHDLRRTARSLMSRASVATDHAERSLGHVLGGIRGVYDVYEYEKEKASAYEALARLISCIVNPADNVRAIDERRLRTLGRTL